jgi:undecaprenyl-diphosphatase
MQRSEQHPWVLKAGLWDQVLCEQLNALGKHKAIKDLFCGFSRLGDGVLWYSILFIMPFWYGLYGLWVSLITLCSCYLCMSFYKSVKLHFVRERPFVTHKSITPYTLPLDRYSFPSGHTMNAMHCALVLSFLLPGWYAFMVFCVSGIALSRVILGMHYPSDVILGAVLGSCTASLTIWGVSWLAAF